MIIVNIGANNGLDACRDFVFKNVPRITMTYLIEPSPEALNECKKNYTGITRTEFHNTAIALDDSRPTFLYRPRGEPSSGHSSTDKGLVSFHGHSDIEKIEVNSTSLENFFKKNKIARCDRLYIDAEGLDCEILLHLDIKKYKIQRIEFEKLHTDGPMTWGENYRLLIKRLHRLGYITRPTSDYNITAYRIKSLFSLFLVKCCLKWGTV